MLSHDPDLVHAPPETAAEPTISNKLASKAVGKTKTTNKGGAKTASKAKGKSVEQPSTSTRAKRALSQPGSRSSKRVKK